MKSGELQITEVREYSADVASGLGRLMRVLSEDLANEPIAEDRLRAIIESPTRAQLIAELQGRVVGAATLNLIVSLSGTKAWLDDFVVNNDESIRGQGVGYKLWSEMLSWSREQGATSLQFTSKSTREAAQIFYRRQGARERDTIPFRIDL